MCKWLAKWDNNIGIWKRFNNGSDPENIIIVLREILISALREWAAIDNFKKPLEVNALGKYKTFFQMFSIGFLLFNGTIFTINTYIIGLYGIYIASFLSLISMIIYL